MLERDEYYLQILDYPKEELFSIINKTTSYLLHMIIDEFENEEKDLPYDIVIDLVFLYAFYDGYVTDDKKYIIKDVFDVEMDEDKDYIEFSKLRVKNLNKYEKHLQKMRKDGEFADAEFLLALAIYALDGEITKDEQILIEKNIRQDIRKSINKGVA